MPLRSNYFKKHILMAALVTPLPTSLKKCLKKQTHERILGKNINIIQKNKSHEFLLSISYSSGWLYFFIPEIIKLHHGGFFSLKKTIGLINCYRSKIKHIPHVELCGVRTVSPEENWPWIIASGKLPPG